MSIGFILRLIFISKNLTFISKLKFNAQFSINFYKINPNLSDASNYKIKK